MLCRCAWLLLLLQLATPAVAGVELEGSGSLPVHVYYPDTVCRGGEIELEVWSRSRSVWAPHPRHPRIPVGACQLEDEKLLWDEMRWRCADGGRWIVGIDMFDDGGAQRCGLPRDAYVFGDMRIELTSPEPGVAVRAPDPAATVVGDVLVGGRRGVQYDIVIAVDVSAPGGRERIAQQVAAARRSVRHASHRLGEVRIGLVVHPHPGAAAPGRARREVAVTEDRVALEAALDRIEARGPADARVDSDFRAALAFGMAETQRLQLRAHEGARLYSRKRVLISGGDTPAIGASESRILDLARGARERGIAIHLFALDAAPQRQPEWVESMLRLARGSFTRVEPSGDGSLYLREAGLAYLSDLTVSNLTTGQVSREVRFDETGHFSARVPAAFGHNEIVVAASSSRGDRVRTRHVFEFDGSLVRERLLAAERMRMEWFRRARQVEIAPFEGPALH